MLLFLAKMRFIPERRQKRLRPFFSEAGVDMQIGRLVKKGDPSSVKRAIVAVMSKLIAAGFPNAFKAARRYEEFLSAHSKGKVLYLELGVGYNTPGIIKYPFMRFTCQNKKATYITVSKDRPLIPDEIVSQTIAVQADLSTFIETLLTLS